jgi:hypothetical protein
MRTIRTRQVGSRGSSQLEICLPAPVRAVAGREMDDIAGKIL